MTKNVSRLERMQNFVEQHLLREEAASEALSQEINRLTTEEIDILNSFSQESIPLLVKLWEATCDYKRALRLALTIADTHDLPDQDSELVRHTFKLAGEKYRLSKSHGVRTSISNSERPETHSNFYKRYVEVAFVEYLYENGGKAPGRSKLKHATRRLMQHEGVSREKINGLTDNEVRKFLVKRKASMTSGPGLIGRLMKNAEP